MGATSIEWTKPRGFAGATWNPLRGCSMVSSGCSSCYAMKQAHRHSGAGRPYAGLTRMTSRGPVWTGEVRLVPEALDAPLRARTPRCYFVNSMSDLFHPAVSDEFIARVFCTMIRAPRHRFIVLTKRSARMCDAMQGAIQRAIHAHCLLPSTDYCREAWPPKNVWLGVSAEDQATADERIPLLLDTPAAVRLVSLEPMISRIDLSKWLPYHKEASHERQRSGVVLIPSSSGHVLEHISAQRVESHHLHWLICGGESGPGARPCDVAWIRSIVRQGRDAGVATFVKQAGAHVTDRNDAGYCGDGAQEWPDGTRTGDSERWQGAPNRVLLRDRKGGDPSEWPEDLRVREWPMTQEAER